MQPAIRIEEVIRREHEALAAETRLSGCPPFVAVNQLEDVARLPSRLRVPHPASCAPLPGSSGQCYVLTCPSLDSHVLWTRTENSAYREHYLAFLNQVYGMSLEKLDNAYDVDHLYNRDRARLYGLAYLRLALVPRSANRSHGASVEKDLTVNEALRKRRDHKLMDEIASMKYFGFLAPLRDDPREDEVEAYCKFAQVQLGLDPQEVRKGIHDLRSKASKPWAAAGRI